MIFLILFLVLPFLVGMATWIYLFGNYHLTGSATISRKSWHFRYMTWSLSFFNRDPTTFKSICIYSWTFVLMFTFVGLWLLFLLFYFVGKLVYKGAIVPIAWVSDRCADATDHFLTSMANKLSDVKNLSKLNKFGEKFLTYLDHYDYARNWYAHNEGHPYRKHARIAQKMTEEQRMLVKARLEELKREREEARLRKLDKAVQVTKFKIDAKTQAKLQKAGKWLVYILGSAIGLLVLYLLGKLFVWSWWFMFTRVNWALTLPNLWALVKGFLILLLLTVLASAALTLIIVLFRGIGCKLGACIPCQERREVWGNYLLKLLNLMVVPFAWLVSIIGKVASFIWGAVKAAKEENCAFIDWE